MSNSDRINAAIRECLAGCYVAQNPLLCLAEYVTKLRADASWPEADVLEVEVAVRHMLKRIMSEQNDIMS